MGSCSGAAVWDSFLFNPAPARQGVATARLQMAPGPLGPGKASSNTRRTTLRGEQATHLSFIQRNWLLHRCKTWCERHIGIGCGWTATIWFFHSSHWEIWAAPSKHPSRASGVKTILTFHLSQQQTATRCSTRLTQPLAHAQAGFLKSAYYINLERNRCRGTDGDPCLMDLRVQLLGHLRQFCLEPLARATWLINSTPPTSPSNSVAQITLLMCCCLVHCE